MTSSNGNIYRVTGPSCGGFIGHLWLVSIWLTRGLLCPFDLHKDLYKERRANWHYDVAELILSVISWRITKTIHDSPIEKETRNVSVCILMHLDSHYSLNWIKISNWYGRSCVYIVISCLVSFTVSIFNTKYRWLIARQQYLHCWRSGDTAVLHWTIDVLM